MKKGWLIVALLITLGIGGETVFAQSTDLSPQREKRPINRERAAELRKRIELIWMWRMTEELELTEEEGGKVFPLLRTYEEKKRSLGEERKQLLRELRQMIDNEETTDADLSKAIKALEKNNEGIQNVTEKGFHEIAKILPVKKQAQYIVFQEHFRREIHTLIERSKRQDKRPRRP